MISVCIATYNGEKFIRQQLQSIIMQLSPGDEVIISDDGSTDRTLQIVEEMRSSARTQQSEHAVAGKGKTAPAIRILLNEGEHGYTPNFENALRHAKGDYIFLSDQDDVWAPNKVEVTLRSLKHHSMVIADADIVDAEGNVIAESYFRQRGARSGLVSNLIRFSYLGCMLAFRREVRDKALPFPPNHSLCTHDNWLALVAMTFFSCTVLPDKLLHYRRHGANASKGGLEKTTTLAFKIRYRVYLLKWLAKICNR